MSKDLTMEEMEQAQAEVLDGGINFEASGTDMIVGGVVGGTLTFTVAYKLGYAGGVKDAAAAHKEEPKKLLKMIKAMKGESKGTIFGFAIRSPFYKPEKKADSDSEKSDDKVEEEEKEPKPKTRKTRKSE